MGKHSRGGQDVPQPALRPRVAVPPAETITVRSSVRPVAPPAASGGSTDPLPGLGGAGPPAARLVRPVHLRLDSAGVPARRPARRPASARRQAAPIGWRGRIAALLMLAAAMVVSWLIVSASTKPEWPVPAALEPAPTLGEAAVAAGGGTAPGSSAAASRSGAVRAEAKGWAPVPPSSATGSSSTAIRDSDVGAGTGTAGVAPPVLGDRSVLDPLTPLARGQPSDGSDVIDPVEAPGAPSSGSTSWLDLLERMEDNRSAAFATGDPVLLRGVYAVGSPALRADEAALAALDNARLRAVGLRLQIDEVTVEAAAADAVTLRVADRLPGYRLVDAAGATVAVEPGRGRTTWLITVVPSPGGWLISGIEHL